MFLSLGKRSYMFCQIKVSVLLFLWTVNCPEQRITMCMGLQGNCFKMI